MNRVAMVVLMASLCQATLADNSAPPNPNALQPPHPIYPQTGGHSPLSGTDSYTQSLPMGGTLDTMTTQSTGSYNDYHPQSHPIPLNQNGQP